MFQNPSLVTPLSERPDIANKIEAGHIDVTSVTWLVKKVVNKNRLMKVQMANLSQKRRLLINAKKLKQSSGDF